MCVTIDPRCGQRTDGDDPCRSLVEFHATNEGDILDIFSAVFNHQVSRKRRCLWRQARKIDIVQIAAPKLLKVVIEDWWCFSTYCAPGGASLQIRRMAGRKSDICQLIVREIEPRVAQSQRIQVKRIKRTSRRHRDQRRCHKGKDMSIADRRCRQGPHLSLARLADPGQDLPGANCRDDIHGWHPRQHPSQPFGAEQRERHQPHQEHEENEQIRGFTTAAVDFDQPDRDCCQDWYRSFDDQVTGDRSRLASPARNARDRCSRNAPSSGSRGA